MPDYSLIPAFCINLDRRPDRWSKVEREFSNLAWPVNRVSAVETPKELVTRLKSPAAGCLESHRKVWRMVSGLESDVAAVFEDDVVFPSDFGKVFPEAFSELPEDWKVWHLHSFGIKQMRNFKINGKHITKLNSHGWGSHGYLVRRHFAETLLSTSTKMANKPVDMLLTLGIKSKGFQPYGVIPESTLCFQRGEDTDILHGSQCHYWRKALNRFKR